MNIDSANFQTQTCGSNEDEYEIYVACAEALGWEILTYAEWMAN